MLCGALGLDQEKCWYISARSLVEDIYSLLKYFISYNILQQTSKHLNNKYIDTDTAFFLKEYLYNNVTEKYASKTKSFTGFPPGGGILLSGRLQSSMCRKSRLSWSGVLQ